MLGLGAVLAWPALRSGTTSQAPSLGWLSAGFGQVLVLMFNYGLNAWSLTSAEAVHVPFPKNSVPIVRAKGRQACERGALPRGSSEPQRLHINTGQQLCLYRQNLCNLQHLEILTIAKLQRFESQHVVSTVPSKSAPQPI